MSGAQKVRGKPMFLQKCTVNMWFQSQESQEMPHFRCVLSEFIVFFSDETEITSDEIKIISDKI